MDCNLSGSSDHQVFQAGMLEKEMPFPSPGDLPDPRIEPRSPPLQADALPSEPLGKPKMVHIQVPVDVWQKPTRYCKALESESHSVMSDSLQPHGLYSPWNSPGQNTGVASLSFL